MNCDEKNGHDFTNSIEDEREEEEEEERRTPTNGIGDNGTAEGVVHFFDALALIKF